MLRLWGGEVKPNDVKEIGWYPLTMDSTAAQDLLLNDYPSRSPAYHFHGDYIASLPDSIWLAHSDLTACQAFRFGKSVYGFQYHLEVDQPLVEEMCDNNASYMRSNGFEPDLVIADSRTHIEEFITDNVRVLSRWVSLL
ncbi:MAG: hypothetical protein AseanaTS_07040 [Candidatus Pelagadaptatus aseana]